MRSQYNLRALAARGGARGGAGGCGRNGRLAAAAAAPRASARSVRPSRSRSRPAAASLARSVAARRADAPSRPSSVFRPVRGSEATENGTVEGDLREEATRAAKHRGVPGGDGAYLHCSSSIRWRDGRALLRRRGRPPPLPLLGGGRRRGGRRRTRLGDPRRRPAGASLAPAMRTCGAPSGLPYAALEGRAAIPLGADGKHAMPEELLRM